jgi:hypothetical protein
MTKMRFILLVILLIFTGLAIYGYMYFNYTDGYKWIDLRKTWPKGYWMQAKFVVMGNYGEEGIAFNVPLDYLGKFEQVLKREVKRSPKSYCPRWDIYQLRIVTAEGKYTTVAVLDSDSDEIFANTWQSKNLKKALHEWGYKKPQCDGPPPSDSIFRKSFIPTVISRKKN